MPKRGLDLTSRDGIVREDDPGIAFDAAAPDSSLLLKAILCEGPELPPTGRMAAGQTARSAAWIRSGLPWPAEITTLHLDAPRRAMENQSHRSASLNVKHSLRDPILESSDTADSDQTSPIRFVTTHPTQAPGLLNGDFSFEQAGGLAKRITEAFPESEPEQLRFALKLVTKRNPTDEEIDRGLSLMKEFRERDGLSKDEARRDFWLMALNLNDSLLVDGIRIRMARMPKNPRSLWGY